MSTIAHFSLEHYEHMVDVGSFAGEFRKRVELIRGEIIEMSPIGTEHAEVVNRLTEWSFEVTQGRSMRVRVQDPIRIPKNDSEPEPDVVWVADRNYARVHPGPSDVALVIEVSDSTLGFDRSKKLSVYAEAGIADYWIVNLLDQQIEVYRAPAGLDFDNKSIHRASDAVHPLALPQAALQPSRLFE